MIRGHGKRLPVPPPPPPPGGLPIALPAKVLRWMGPLTPASSTTVPFKAYETTFVTAEAARWAADGPGGCAGGMVTPPGGCKPNQQFDFTNYYDRAYLLYQFWARTGNQVYRDRADAIMRCYRDGYLEPNQYGAQPHNAQLEGLAVHYWLTGDLLSKKAVVEYAKRMYPIFSADLLTAQGENYVYWEGRIFARMLMAVLLCLELGDTSMNWGKFADDLVRETIRLQHADGSYFMPDYYGGGPGTANYQGTQANFSAAMLNYAWARYYFLRTPDPKIPAAVKKCLDYLWTTQWKGTGFAYSNKVGEAVAADLTGMLVYGWGFYANVSGDLTYQTTGDKIFAAMIAGFYNGQKQFNQQYRETALYLGLRK